MQTERTRGLFDITRQELFDLFKPSPNPEGFTKAVLIFVGLILSPITLLGSILFYQRGYSRFMEGEFPRLYKLPPIVRVGMILGAILIWVGLYLAVKPMIYFLSWIFGDSIKHYPIFSATFLAVNVLITVFVFLWFSKWRGGIIKYLAETKRHGSARFATQKELEPYRQPQGFYAGLHTFYKKAGHLLTVAGTRAGKGVNLLLPNLLMPWLFRKTSFVVIDPKGELAAVSANAQRKAGRKVVILNPWKLLMLANIGYNPLDILKNDPLCVVDDVAMIAESIVPTSKGGSEENHFADKSRSFISTLLLHLVTSAPKKDRHLGTLWQWLRLDHEAWIKLLADMMTNDDPHVGDIIKAGANEIASLMKNSDREYGSVMSSAQKYTDFIKSPTLRESMKGSDDFSSDDLASGNVTVYLCIPFDQMKSYSAWLRLVVTSLMRSVVRNPKHDVCFLIEEAYSFGYHSEIDMALGAYAGFGIHVWSIFQTLGQIKNIYGDNWENFIANCSVRHFFNISDNFSADYLSSMFGQTSIPSYNEKGELTGASARPLVTQDELRRQSGETIYAVIDQLPPVQIPKFPYFKMGLECDPNPYYKPEVNN
jgi:type IV secretion system protein VirD4